MADREFKIGSFYWVLPNRDVDADEPWENEQQPARYAGKTDAGEDIWQFIAGGNTDNYDRPWGCRWVGEEIIYKPCS